MSTASNLVGTFALCLGVGLTVSSPAYAQATAAPDAQNCKAPPVQQSANGDNSGAAQDTEITGSTKLSGCGGVINPPDTGDKTLVQPAPQTGNMPVMKPKDLPAQRQNAQ